MTEVLTTHALPPEARFAAWKEVTGRMLAPVEVRTDDEAGFRAEARLVDLGAIRVTAVTCAAYEAYRSPRLIRRADPQLYQLTLTIRGRSSLSQRGGEVTLGPGDLVLYDTSRPFRVRAVPAGAVAQGVMVAFPRQLLPVPDERLAALLPAHLAADAPMTALLGGFLVDVVREGGGLTPADTARVAMVLVDLLAAVLSGRLGADVGVPPANRRRVQLVGIQAYIEQHLGDPTLSPASIAAANHVSTRYLHKLFAEDGRSVGAWLRDRRLARCRRDLADPCLDGCAVGAIAARWGFLDAAHFSRVFRATHGLPPTAYRVATRRGPDG